MQFAFNLFNVFDFKKTAIIRNLKKEVIPADTKEPATPAPEPEPLAVVMPDNNLEQEKGKEQDTTPAPPAAAQPATPAPGKPETEPEPSTEAPRCNRWGEFKILENSDNLVGTHNHIKVYKNRIIDMYKKFPKEFTRSDVAKYILKMYPGLKQSSAKNTASAYIKFCEAEGFIFSPRRAGRSGYMYMFKVAPYDAVKAEFNPQEMNKRKMLELETYRKEK